MPPIETMEFNQKAVLWRRTGINANAEPRLASPVEISCRWDDTPKAHSGAANDETIRIDATAIVDRDIPIGSDLWLGTLNDFYGVGSAGDEVNVMTVVSSRRVPDLKGIETWRSVSMSRKRGAV